MVLHHWINPQPEKVKGPESSQRLCWTQYCKTSGFELELAHAESFPSEPEQSLYDCLLRRNSSMETKHPQSM